MNRTEEKKMQKKRRREKKKHFIIILLCLIFFIFMIYITDVSTSKMMQKSDDKYAVYAKYENNGIIRVDMAGETIQLYLDPLVNVLKTVTEWLNEIFNLLIKNKY